MTYNYVDQLAEELADDYQLAYRLRDKELVEIDSELALYAYPPW